MNSDPSVIVERHMVRFVAVHAKTTEVTQKVYLAAEPLPGTDGETDCWTHAREYVESNGGRYVEGFCLRPGNRLAPHAWVEQDHPLGGVRLIEVTRGYRYASGYRGLAVDLDATADDFHDGRRRYSALQLAIFEQRDPKTILAQIGA